MNTATLALFLVVVVLAAVLGVSLYASLLERKSLEEKLGECRSRLGEATSKASELESELSSCRSELASVSAVKERVEAELERVKSLYDSLVRNYTRLKDEYRALSAEYNQTVREYARLLGEHEELKSRLDRLQENYTALMDAYEGLEARYASLEESYKQLYTNYTVLIDKYSRLYEDYTVLASRYERLQEDYDELKRDYSIVSSQYEGLRREYLALKSDYESLREDYEDLSRLYSRLYENYTVLYSMYEDLASRHDRLVGGLENASMWLGLMGDIAGSRGFYSAILGVSVEQVKSLVDYAGFSGDLGWRAFDIFETLLYWLYYCPDNYVRYVDYSTFSVGVRGEVFMLPNETWARKCGDCEDLALFTYALLKATELPGEKFYIVEFHDQQGVGHAGVLAVKIAFDARKYYVIDLAGNYISGISVFYQATIVAPNGAKWRVYFNPMELSYHSKSVLDGLVETVYYDHYTGEELTGEKRLYYYTDAFTALRDWIVDFWGVFPVDRVVVIGEGVYKVFTSITDAAKWIEENVVQDA